MALRRGGAAVGAGTGGPRGRGARTGYLPGRGGPYGGIARPRGQLRGIAGAPGPRRGPAVADTRRGVRAPGAFGLPYERSVGSGKHSGELPQLPVHGVSVRSSVGIR